MSDNKNFEEEYQFVEEPEFEPIDVEPEPEPTSEAQTNETLKDEVFVKKTKYFEQFISMIREPSIKRNALIAVVGLFLLLTLLKCVGRPSIEHTNETIKPIVEKNIQPIENSVALQAETNQMQNLMEMQRNLQNNLATVNEKMNQLNIQLNSLNANNQMFQQQIGQLIAKLQSMQQSMEEAIAAAKARPQIRSSVRHGDHVYRPVMPKIHYYVQAIIPGRAWLVSSQGQTLTLRVGSTLPGYGIVKSIDADQGRVMMSTGKVFIFNPAD